MLFIAAIGLAIIIYTPIWRIELNAPQYPEGLSLTIHANGLKGNVDIINGLNHYIGMKTLHNEDFFEFTIMPYCILFFAIASIGVAFVNRRAWLNILFVLFVSFGVIAMIDFWKWEYNYGHHLNPNAAIIVPGMAYQPPLIGFKQLLNFGAYSIPDIGGWLFIVVGAILLILVIYEWDSYKKRARVIKPVGSPIAILLFILTIIACNTRPEPIIIGKDNCDYCKMTVSDNRFGAEIITQKGKIYKFDDAHCALSFLRSGNTDHEQAKEIYFTDFSSSHSLINANDALFLKSDELRSPMGGNIAAFSNADSLNNAMWKYKGTVLHWKEIYKL